jgi:DNA-3-methyladenine glycosylase II
MVQGLSPEHRGAEGRAESHILTAARLEAAAVKLADGDSDFAGIIERWGIPPLWNREPDFATLVLMILEQQVSLSSAAAAMDKLVAEIGRPVPGAFLALDDADLLRFGFSRQKRRYTRDLAERLADGRLDLSALDSMQDFEARARLMEVKGIGIWTADVYLLMVLLRPDVWPVGDRALVVAARVLKRMDEDPDPAAFEEMGEAWRPLRSVAARLLWHFYLREVRPVAGRVGQGG